MRLRRKRRPAELYGAWFHFRSESSVSVLRIPGCEFYAESGFPSFGALSFFISDQGVFQYTYTAYDNVSYTHGKHNFKFGFEFHHSRFRGIGAPGFLDGVLNFNGGNAFRACGGLVPRPQPLAGGTPLPPICRISLLERLGSGNQILVNPQQELPLLASTGKRSIFQTISG